MWMALLLGILLALLAAYFMLLFFHLNRLERLLTESLQEVEIHLLQMYGEVPPKKVKEVRLDEDS